jgi:hypothetical protein
MPKNAEKFYCNVCDFICSKQSNYVKHLLTRKHNFRTNLNISNKKNADGSFDENFMTCKHCTKIYKTRSGLWYHEKKCQKMPKNIIQTSTSEIVTPELIISVIQQNKDLQNLLVEQSKTMMEICSKSQQQQNQIIMSNSNNTMTNSNNKTFNLQFFLNETCKNAMNISEFVDSLQLQLSDLENVARLGFVDGLSNIIIKNLKALDVTMRPVHCSDTKRETVYVKDDDKWEKDENNSKLRKAVKYIAHKNTKLIPQWKAKHPDCMESTSKYSDQYNNMMIEALGGDSKLNVSEDKIIRKIAKEMVIDKKMD